jgi:hypothetical protein
MLSELPPGALDSSSRLASFEALWDGNAFEGKGKPGLGRADSSALSLPRQHSDAFQSRPLVRTTTFDEVDDDEESDGDEPNPARFTRRGSSAVLGDEAGALLEVQVEAVHCAHEIKLLKKQIEGYSASNGACPEKPSDTRPIDVALIAERAQQL